VTDKTVEVAFVDQEYTGDDAKSQAEEHAIRLERIKLSATKKGFVLLLRLRVVKRGFG
jgi:hypothetical protein